MTTWELAELRQRAGGTERLKSTIRLIWSSASGLSDGPIGRAAIQSMLIRVGALGGSFTQGMLTARLLGPQGYGAFAFAMSVASIAATVAAFGLGGLSVREVAHRSAQADADSLRSFLRESLTAVVATSAIAAVGISMAASMTQLLDPPFRGAVALAAVLVPPIALLTFFRGIAQGFGRISLAQVPSDLLRPLAMTLLLGVLLLSGQTPGVSMIIGLYFGVITGAVMVGGLPLRREFRGAAKGQPLSRLVRAALPFAGIALVAILQGEINLLLLGLFAGPTEAGLFQPVVRVAPLILIGAQAAGMRYAPRVSELRAREDMVMLRRVTRLFTLATTGVAAAVAGLLLLAGPWLLSAFGAVFVASAPLLWWIALAQVFSTACGPVGMLLTMTERTGAALLSQLAGLAVNVALGVWLIPSLGAEGAAQAMVGGIVVWNLAMLVFVRRALGFDPSLLGAVWRSGVAET